MRAVKLFRFNYTCNPSRIPVSQNIIRYTKSIRLTVCTESSDRVSEVIVADPRKILEAGLEGGSLQLTVPLTFLPQLSSPKFELGDADDPMSSYSFGKRKEIFQYSFAGSVSTQSGWVGIITKQSLNKLQPDAISWKALQSSAEENGGSLKGSMPHQPFLFVGQILEAAGVSVYTSHEGPQLDGVLISTSDDDIPTP